MTAITGNRNEVASKSPATLTGSWDPGLGAFNPAARAGAIVTFDSDTDTGDSVSWEYGFFGGGTQATMRDEAYPTKPRQSFKVFIGRWPHGAWEGQHVPSGRGWDR